PTLDVVAYPHLPSTVPLCTLVAAGRGRYCWTTYAAETPRPQRTREWGLQRLPEILSELTPPVFFAGELSAGDRKLLAETWPQPHSVCPPALAVRRGGVLAELAWERWQRGETVDAATLTPIYLS
ncbi:MAG: hypothetical protein D6791_03100, partial [Chloroflexi bacterium]